jgi:hypothetical protein
MYLNEQRIKSQKVDKRKKRGGSKRGTKLRDINYRSPSGVNHSHPTRGHKCHGSIYNHVISNDLSRFPVFFTEIPG